MWLKQEYINVSRVLEPLSLISVPLQTKIPYAYFGIFDGHAGAGASLMTCNLLHLHITDKLTPVKELLAFETDDKLQTARYLAEAVVSSITIDSLVIGALEEAFFEMVSTFALKPGKV